MATTKRRPSTEKMVTVAILTALVIVMQFVSMNLRFATFSITLTLLPIVIGGALCGIGAGAWLGLVFGIIVLATGDAAFFMGLGPNGETVAGTIITVLVKGTAAGAASAAVYKLLSGFNRYVATVAAAIIAPIVNTGVFTLGCYIFFYDYISAFATDGGMSSFAYIIIFFIGINFIIEFATNAVLSPVAVRLVDVVKKKK